MEDVDFILSCMGHDHQKLLFSATMPAEIDLLAQNQLKNPVQVKLISKKIPETIDHYFIATASRNRIDSLLSYVSEEDIEQAIIFVTPGSMWRSSMKYSISVLEVLK